MSAERVDRIHELTGVLTITGWVLFAVACLIATVVTAVTIASSDWLTVSPAVASSLAFGALAVLTLLAGRAFRRGT